LKRGELIVKSLSEHLRTIRSKLRVMLVVTLATLITVAASGAACAQGAPKLSTQQLDSLTAPIALYPDALLAQVLMAATFPQEVQQAADWSKANPNVKGDEP